MTAAAAAAPAKRQAWLMAIRPPTLTASVAPVLVGTGVAIAVDGFHLVAALAALIGAICLQIGANFANDVFDFRRGADTADRLGPPRATQMGFLSQREVFTGMWFVFALATLAGVVLAIVSGWEIIAVGIVCILGAIVYTGGPWPVAYHALGDVFTFLFFGFVAVLGTVYVQSGELPTLGWLAAIPAGCTVTAILVVNNLRDIETDRRARKITLAVLLGDRGTRTWYAILLGVAFVIAIAIGFTSYAEPWTALVLLAIPAALPPFRTVWSGVTGRPLNLVLKGTARFHLVFGALFAVGLALSRL